jgi:hypothetical protein
MGGCALHLGAQLCGGEQEEAAAQERRRKRL